MAGAPSSDSSGYTSLRPATSAATQPTVTSSTTQQIRQLQTVSVLPQSVSHVGFTSSNPVRKTSFTFHGPDRSRQSVSDTSRDSGLAHQPIVRTNTDGISSATGSVHPAASTTRKRRLPDTHSQAAKSAASEHQLQCWVDLAAQDKPTNLPSFVSQQTIAGTWTPTDDPAMAPAVSDIAWSRMPPVPMESLPQWEETQAAARAGVPTQTHGLIRTQERLRQAAQGRAKLGSLKPKTAEQRAAVKPLQDVRSRADYMAAIRARFMFVLDKSRKAGTVNQQAFYLEWWTQHCLFVGTSPFRWRWAKRHLMSGVEIAEEEGLLTTFCAACSIRWASFDLISQALSHVFTFHERYMLCPRPSPMPILVRWLDDCRRQMLREMGLPKGRDALLPREVNTALGQVVNSWCLPTVQQFLETDPRSSTLTWDTTTSSWTFTPCDTRGVNGDIAVHYNTPASLPLEMAMALAMSLGSQFAFRMGNLAVGVNDFDPILNWSCREVVKMAELARAEPGDALILAKPITKTSANASKRSRTLAAEPIPLVYDPAIPGHPVAIAVMIHWMFLSHLAPATIATIPAIANYRTGDGASLQDYNSWQARTVQRYLPDWAAVLNLTQYSLRIGAATAWTLAGAKPEELDHLGAWASAIGREVYSRMAVKRRLEIQHAAAMAQGTTLDSLLNVAASTRDSTSAVYVSESGSTSQPPQHVRSQNEQQHGQRNISDFWSAATRQSAPAVHPADRSSKRKR